MAYTRKMLLAGFPDGAERTAPQDGYDTPAKAAYRNAVWDCFAQLLPNLHGGKILFMPSREGLEIEVALSRGFKPTDLIAVDRSAAVIATSLWRRRHPDVAFFAGEIADAPRKLADRGVRLIGANLDLCGKVSSDTTEQVRAFFAHAPRFTPFTLAVTVAKGREDTTLVSLLRHRYGRPVFKEPRLDALFHMAGMFGNGVTSTLENTILSEGSYVSGKHPMAWAVVKNEDTSSWVDRECQPITGMIKMACSLISEGAHGQASRVLDALVQEEVRLGFTKDGAPNDWPDSRKNAFCARTSVVPRWRLNAAQKRAEDHFATMRDEAWMRFSNMEKSA